MAPTTTTSSSTAAVNAGPLGRIENLNPQRPYQSLTRKGIVAGGGSLSSSSSSSSSSSYYSSKRPSALVVDSTSGGNVVPTTAATQHRLRPRQTKEQEKQQRQRRQQQQQQQQQQQRRSDGSKEQHKKTKKTGIERSYDSVTKTLRSTLGGSLGSTTTTTTTTRGGPGPPAPVASSSFSTASSSSTVHVRGQIGEHLRSISASMSHDEYEKLRDESRQLKAEHEARYSSSGGVASSIDLVAPASPGGGGGGAIIATTGGARREEGVAVAAASGGGSAAGGSFGHSTSTAPVDNNKHLRRVGGGVVDEDLREQRSSGIEVARSTGMHPARHGVHGGEGGGGGSNNKHPTTTTKTKGVARMTSEGLHRIRDILGAGTGSNDTDEMSFFCSDGDTGLVTKQKFSLDADRDRDHGIVVVGGREQEQFGAEDHNGGGGGGGERLATVVEDPPQDGGCGGGGGEGGGGGAHHIRRIGTGIACAARRNVGAASADAAVHDAAHGMIGGTGGGIIARATKKAVGVARQGVGGANALARDLASNAKTPARSNVTGANNNGRQEMRGADGAAHRFADYVHDPNYRVVLTPPPPARDEGGGAAAAAPYYYFDPRTPACLAGAIVAGRCDLSPTNPESMEYLPGGIPRVLVVHGDWEERAGFVPASSGGAASATTSSWSAAAANNAGYDANGYAKYAVEAKAGVSRDMRRISNPVDVDEETATINGEEVNVEEMWALRHGRETPTAAAAVAAAAAAAKNDVVDNDASRFNYDVDDDHLARVGRMGRRSEDDGAIREGIREENDGSEFASEEDDNDRLRNASMWVAVPENYMDEDSPDDYLDRTMCIGDKGWEEKGGGDDDDDDDECVDVGEVCMGDLLNDDIDLVTPLSTGGDTFFVGDVCIGFESPEDAKMDRIVATAARASCESPVVKDASSSDEVKQLLVEEEIGWTPKIKNKMKDATGASKYPEAVRATKIEDFDVCQGGTSSKEPPITSNSFGEDQSLASFAKSLTAAVISDQHQQTKTKEFETPYSVRKGERPLTFTEFKGLNKQVLFDMKDGERVYHWERPADLGENHAIHPSESTELSHEPPVRMVDSGGGQELHAHPSESTDLSLYSNWAVPPKVEGLAAASGKRQLKGRIILVRIKKKISKVAKKMLFYPWKKKDGDENIEESITDENGFVVPHPKSDYAIPGSPSAASVMSVTSSIMTGSGTKRIIGAVPPKIGSPSSTQQFMYGAVNYGNRGSPESSAGGYDSLPAPPGRMPLPPRATSKGEEDAVSYLAEAMRHAQGDDDEDSVLLLVTPKDDGTGEDVQVISAMDGTPVPIREIIDALSERPSNGDYDSSSGFKPNNLSCLFTDEKGGNPTIEIMDAVEFNGGIVLTPHNINQNVARVFRPSTDASSAKLLPGSLVCDSEDEDETLYHDGCTVIHQTSTFGDNTIATILSARAATKNEVASVADSDASKMARKKAPPAADYNTGIGTPILSPDGPPLTRQAATNGSFLFSPNNMGRADPIIRAKERVLSKVGNGKPSITMLPSAKTKTSTGRDGENEALAIRQSHSYSSIETYNVDEAPTKKQVMSSLTEDRQFPFHDILHKFSTDASLEDVSSLQRGSDESCDTPSAVLQDKSRTAPTSSTDEVERMNTPPVRSAATRKTFPKTPFPMNEIEATAREVTSPALIVVVNNVASSPSNASISSSMSVRGVSGSRKRSPAQDKSVPKSALKTRRGFVKDRVSDIQHRISVPGAFDSSTNDALTPSNGRLKRNHSYRLKKTRRTTNGNGALAPHKAVLRTTYIRSVPIAIAKSYSRDSRDEKSSFVEDVKVNTSINFASKYTAEWTAEKTFTKSKQVDSAERSSPDSVKAGGSSVSDASSYVSETTYCDPFNSLLGTMTGEDEESSSSEEEEEGEAYTDRGQDKENRDDAMSPSAHLPFKSTTLVKPAEINLRENCAPLSPVPQKALAWRVMAAKAELEKGQSSRFRSERSWKEISH